MPKLRFRDSKGNNFLEWLYKSIKDIGTVYTGNTPTTSCLEYYGNEYPWITPSDIQSDSVIFSSKKMLSERGYKKCRQLPAGAVLITCIASIGKNVILGKAGSCNQQINAIVPKEDMSSYFILYALTMKTKDLLSLGGNGGMKIVKKSIFEKMLIPVPSLPEQHKIADFLSSYDEKISIQRERVEALERRKKGLLQKVFSQEIRFKADDGSKFPEWENLNTLDLLKDEKGSIKIGPFGSALKKECFVTKGKKVFAQENVFRNDFKCGKQYVTEEKYNELIGCKLETGDIVISTMGTVGACAIFPKDAEEGIMNSHLLRIRVDKNRVIAEFIAQSIRNAGYIKKQIEILAVGSIMTGLSSSIVQKLIFKLPSLQEQQKIADFFTAIDDQINIEKERLTTMVTIKKGLLQGLFC